MNPQQVPQIMYNYSMMYPQMRPVYPNTVQYPYSQFAPQAFFPRMIPNQMPINPTQQYMNPQIVNQTQVPIQNVTNEINAENPSTKGESNSNQEPMKILTKYKDIYVPSIFLLDYTEKNKEPFNTFVQNQQQQAQNPQIFNKYFNYGYNFEQWKKYVTEIRSKFDELNELVKSKTIILPSPENELEYLMAFPSDYGGLGDIYEDQKYENLKLYDPKDTSKNKENKSFMDLIKFDHDTTWFPLEPNPHSLNKSNINDIFKNINPSVIPPKINFLNSNLNQQTIAPKIDTNIIGSNGGDSKEVQNKKE